MLVRLTLLALVASDAPHRCFATGFYGPVVYLDEGGRRVTESPAFYWELEVKRLARDFHPTEKLFVYPPAEPASGEDTNSLGSRMETLGDLTAEVDHKDFEAALHEGRIKPPDASQASGQDGSARAAIIGQTADTLPAEFDSEFADYHRGAFAFRKGKEHWAEARQAWEKLLARPAEERHYRTVWATFMIGKVLLKSGDAEAVKWFQRTRALVQEGFADSLGMAADSYGWEARSEWKQGHPEKAAPLFLTQLALGDESAVISLKALIPDREPVEGMLNYGAEPAADATPDPAAERARQDQELQQLRVAVKDPLLRRLITMHILATAIDPFFSENTGRPSVKRTERWLATIREAKITKTDDAEYLGWIAYGDGKYDQAAHWLELSSGNTPAALWLKAKLQRRAGKLDDAVKSMAQAWDVIRQDDAYTGWKSPGAEADADESGLFQSEQGGFGFGQSAGGDLGGLRLARSEFVGALDAFLKGNLWSDAAFIAERVLTADELKQYVDQQPPDENKKEGKTGDSDTLRYLLGRRLVREDRYAEAAPYLPKQYQKVLDVYVKALKDGANAALPKPERARAWFTAAWIARYDGMEIMGTEGAPDAFMSGGSFEEPDLARDRVSGTFTRVTYDNNGEHPQKLPIALKPSEKEKQRLAKKPVQPDVRFHYRVIAGALAARAAELLPDNSDELADVLNEAGSWTKDRDQKAAGHYYEMIERRCAKTSIGRAVLAKHWFVDQSDAWSTEQAAAHDALVPPAGSGE